MEFSTEIHQIALHVVTKPMKTQTESDTIFRLLGGVTAAVRSYEILRKNRRTGIKKNDIRRWVARTAFRRKTVR